MNGVIRGGGIRLALATRTLHEGGSPAPWHSPSQRSHNLSGSTGSWKKRCCCLLSIDLHFHLPDGTVSKPPFLPVSQAPRCPLFAGKKERIRVSDDHDYCLQIFPLLATDDYLIAHWATFTKQRCYQSLFQLTGINQDWHRQERLVILDWQDHQLILWPLTPTRVTTGNSSPNNHSFYAGLFRVPTFTWGKH